MIELRGKYNTAKIFTDLVEDTAQGQIIQLMNQEFTKDSIIRVMPDVHAGAGSVIGLVMTIDEFVVPNLVGVDIGCGMLTVPLGLKQDEIDFQKLDDAIRANIPMGPRLNSQPKYNFIEEIESTWMYEEYKRRQSSSKYNLALGTMGGGNHFIEIDKDEYDNLYLVIHSGSRKFGYDVAKYHQDTAERLLKFNATSYQNEAAQLIRSLSSQNRSEEIESALNELRESGKFTLGIPKELAYLTAEYKEKYLEDVQVAQKFATINRERMALDIFDGLELEYPWKMALETRHNYIEFNEDGTGTLRKGAVAAHEYQMLYIPFSMSEGGVLCEGVGNPDWLESAPHGSGRRKSRGDADKEIKMEDYEKSMDGIFTTSVNENTKDEAPQAYKDPDEILSVLPETVRILARLKPIYNIKDSTPRRKYR